MVNQKRVGLTFYYLQTKSSRHQHQKLIHSPDKMKRMLRDIADGKDYRVIRAANKEILAIASDTTVVDLREPISIKEDIVIVRNSR